jgi:hypothetical protein
MPTIVQCIASNIARKQRIAAVNEKHPDNTRAFLQTLLQAQREAFGSDITKLEKEWTALFPHIPAKSEGN